jgi:hypothetical protein
MSASDPLPNHIVVYGIRVVGHKTVEGLAAFRGVALACIELAQMEKHVVLEILLPF